MPDVQQPGYYRDLLARLLEQDDAGPVKPTRTDLEKLVAQRRWKQHAKALWAKRDAGGLTNDSRRTYTRMYHEFERIGVTDDHGDPIYVDIEIGISGEYYGGSRGSYYDPPDPPDINDIEMEYARIDSPNPEGGPLNFMEKLALDDWFEQRPAQDRAYDALMNETGE